MSKKTIFSIFLIVLGVISGLLIIYAYGMSGGNPAITLGLTSVSIICIIIGSVLAFSRLLDRTVNPLVEEIHKDIEDDIQDLKERRFTNTPTPTQIPSPFASNTPKPTLTLTPTPLLLPINADNGA